MMRSVISSNSRVSLAGDQVSSRLADEIVILNYKSGIYYGLDPVGTRIWELIQEARTISEIRGAILEEYEVEPERCERELSELLDQLAAAGLIEVGNAAAD